MPAGVSAGGRAAPRTQHGLPGAGGRRESTGADRAAPRGAGGARPVVLSLDGPTRDGSTDPPLRDVARGARAGPAGADARGPDRALADLLVRAPGPGCARGRSDPEGRGPGGLVPAPPGAATAHLAAGVVAPCRCG